MPRKKSNPTETKPKEAEQPAAVEVAKPVEPEAPGEDKAKKNPGGRPRKISSPEEFDAGVDEYVALCRERNEPILLLGMCLHLGLYGKEALYEYGAYEGYSQSVKRARAIIEHEYEKRLNTNNAAAGPIFALKNFGWRDQQQLDVTSKNETAVTAKVTSTVELDFSDVVAASADEPRQGD